MKTEWDPMIFVGKMGDIMDVAFQLARSGNKARCLRFIAEYYACTPHAAENIGFMAGYYDHETAKMIYENFGVSHPVFGTSQPTPEEAFNAGVTLGKEARRRGDQ